MSKAKALGVRVTVFTRLMGFLFVILGIVTAYFTATTPLLEQVSPIFYLISLMLIASGGIVLISELD